MPIGYRGLASCIGCGCDDDHACERGCYWIRVDYRERIGVCSECVEHAEAWDLGDRTRRATPAAELEASAAGELRILRPEQPRPAGIKAGGCFDIKAGPFVIHVQRSPSGCPHDWPYEDVRDGDCCRWCGISFIRHIFTECP